MALDLLINIPVGIIGAIATLMLMPNYTMQTRRFDLSGFLLLAVGMAVLTLALDGSKGTGLSPLAIAGLVAVGVVALVLYLLHAQNNNRALFSLKLFRTRTFSLGLARLCRTYWQWHVALYDTGFPANWPRFLAVSCRTDDDPDGTRQHGNEANCGTGSESLWLSSGTGGDHAGPVAGHPVVYDYRSAGLVLRFAVRPVFYKEWSTRHVSPP